MGIVVEVLDLKDLMENGSPAMALTRSDVLVVAAEKPREVSYTAQALAEGALNASVKIFAVPGQGSITEGLTTLCCPQATSAAAALDLCLFAVAGFVGPGIICTSLSDLQDILEPAGPRVAVYGQAKDMHETWLQCTRRFLSWREFSHGHRVPSCAFILLAPRDMNFLDVGESLRLTYEGVPEGCLAISTAVVVPSHFGIVAVVPAAA